MVGHLNHFPTAYPRDEIAIVWAAISGADDGRTAHDKIEAAWWLAGFALSFIPEGPHPVGASVPATAEETRAMLQAAAASGTMQAIDWGRFVLQLLAIAQQLVQQWLGS